jgi:hypothetical protein
MTDYGLSLALSSARMSPLNPRVFTAAILLISSVAGCSGSEASERGARGAVVDSSAGTVTLGLDDATYRPTAVSAGGSLGGTISLQNPVSDSVVAVTRDASVCGDSASASEVRAGGGGLGDALVWVDNIGGGKPLPELRRERLTIRGCRFEPRVMAVAAGSTINVFSSDRLEHDMRFYREGAGEPVDHIRTFNAGSVVPSEKIAKAPGIVEARSRFQPWARGYIAVFSHPYFAVTDEKGSFKIDGLPPGTYSVKVWHERLPAPAEQQVTVGADGTGRLDLALALR